MYQACEGINGRNANCRPRNSASPMLPQHYFGSETNVPAPFLQSPNKFYYLSRFTYAFYIISIIFLTLAFFSALAALCSTMATVVTAALTAIALFCVTFLCCVMTASYVLARKAFTDAGRFARVGVKAFAFTWTPLALTTLALASLLASLLYRHRRNRRARRTSTTLRKEGLMSRLTSRFRGGRHTPDRDSYHGSMAKRSYDSGYTTSERDHPTHRTSRFGLGRREKTTAAAADSGMDHGDRGHDNVDYRISGGRPTTAGYEDRGAQTQSDDTDTGASGRGASRFAGATSNGDYTVPGGRTAIGRSGAGVAPSTGQFKTADNVHLNVGRSPGIVSSNMPGDEVRNSTADGAGVAL